MRRFKWLALVTVVLIAALPVLAGGDHKKCTYSTQECLDHMAAKMKTSGWVGVELDFDEATGVPTVTKVVPGSPAQAAGIMPGDVLVALNGTRIGNDNEEALTKARKDWKPGQAVTYTIKRDGQDRQVDLTLAPMPADVMAAWIGNHMLEHVSVATAQIPKK
jgi:S1-C subfamily serine protease